MSDRGEERPSGKVGVSSGEVEASALAGERGMPTINRQRSLQSRISGVLAVGLMVAVGGSLLIWYYSRAVDRPEQARQSAEAATRARAQGDMPLPSLGPIEAPRLRGSAADETDVDDLQGNPDGETNPDGEAAAEMLPGDGDRKSQDAIDSLLGPPPPLEPEGTPEAAMPLHEEFSSLNTGYAAPSHVAAAKSPLERRLSGPAFATSSVNVNVATGPAQAVDPTTDALMKLMDMSAAPPSDSRGATVSGGATAGSAAPAGPVSASASAEPAWLRPTVTSAVSAEVLPTRRFLLPKGSFIDCTLETAIESTLPGMTTCITAVDTFGADGKVVLLERGTKLFGETRGDVARGAGRLFVLWSEARTPEGVVVPLASPGTDELGRAGLPGEVDRHFWERFGAAILITMIEGAIDAAVQAQRGNGGTTVVYESSGASDISMEALKSSVDRAPTVRKNQGDRIQIIVARDLDFRPVYELRLSGAGER